MSVDQQNNAERGKMKRASYAKEKREDREGAGLGGLRRGKNTNELAFTLK